MGNGDGTFQPAQVLCQTPGDTNYLWISSLIAGDFDGDGTTDIAYSDTFTGQTYVLAVSSSGTVQSTWSYPLAAGLVAGDFAGEGRLDLAIFSSSSATVLINNGDGTFTSASQLAISPQATPLVADVNGDGTDDVLVVDGSGNILYRQGIPGQPGSFLPPVTVNPNHPSRDIAWLTDTDVGPVLVSIDAQDDAISFYAYRDGRFVRLDGSFTTGKLPAQIIAAQLSGDGLTDLVVRNAGDGSESVYYATTLSRYPVSAVPSARFHGLRVSCRR